MKALVIAVAFAASSSIASAGAARDARAMDAVDKTTATVIADAGRIGSDSLASLNGNSAPWTPGSRESGGAFDGMTCRPGKIGGDEQLLGGSHRISSLAGLSMMGW